jgi:hypothetical protein
MCQSLLVAGKPQGVIWVPVVLNPYAHMKTTIELPEDLFLQAKRRALEQGTTLKALIEAGLRQSLAQAKSKRAAPYQFPVVTAMAQSTPNQIDLNRLIDEMRDEASASLLANDPAKS